MHTANGNTQKSENILVFDVGSTFTKASAFSRNGSELTWLGRAQAPTTVEDIEIGLANATAAIATSTPRAPRAPPMPTSFHMSPQKLAVRPSAKSPAMRLLRIVATRDPSGPSIPTA